MGDAMHSTETGQQNALPLPVRVSLASEAVHVYDPESAGGRTWRAARTWISTCNSMGPRTHSVTD